MVELTDFSVQTAYSGLGKLWMLMVKKIGDIFEIIGGCESPTKVHSALEHPFHAGVHLRLIDELSPICLFDAFAHSGTKAIIFLD